jgi:hypothetical protein
MSMGLQDREWYKDDRKRRDSMTFKAKKTASQWNAAQGDLDTKTIILWLSIAVNVMLAMALLYVT